MKVSLNKVVAIHYTLTNNEGTVLDSSNGRGFGWQRSWK